MMVIVPDYFRKPEVLKKRTPFRMPAFCEKGARLKGGKLFRSIEENGEWGTPEQWNVKPNT